MAKCEIKGTIVLVEDTEQITDKFKKRLLVVNTGGEYPQEIPIEFTQKNVDKLDDFGTGESVTVQCDLRGREHNGRYYASIQGWKIEADI